MKKRAREIAKVGIFGSKDDPQIVTEHDLEEIAETFVDIKTAPVTFGHWGNAAEPRLGTVTAVTYDQATQSLAAEIEEDDVLAAAVDAGYYPDVSIRSKQRASDGKMYLVHLAYLGQEAPAVKDLAASIKEPLGIAASEAAGLRSFPSPKERRLYLSETPPENPLKNDNKEDTSTGGDSAQNHNKEQSSMTKEEEEKLLAENERLKEEARAKDIALSDASKERRQAARARLESVMNEKGIPKPAQEKAFALSDALEDGKVIELSDSAGEKRKVSPLDCLIEIVGAFHRPVEPGILNLSDGGDAGSGGNAQQIDFGKI